MKTARVLEVIVGVVFLVAAATKTYDMYGFAAQVGEYGIFPADPDTKYVLAWVLTAIEAVIGAALIAGLHPRNLLLAITGAMLVVFSILIAYGWAFHDLKDCGCFGATIQLGPGPSIIKNLILLAMVGFAWVELRKTPADMERKLQSPALAAAGAGLAAVFAVTLVGGQPTVDDGTRVEVEVADEVLADRPFAEYVYTQEDESERNLGEGAYLVAVLNADCEHCRASVTPLNEYSMLPDMPLVVGLVMANDASELEEFKAFTSPLFETYTIDVQTMFALYFEVANAPPIFHAVKDGAVADSLHAEELKLDDLLTLVESLQTGD